MNETNTKNITELIEESLVYERMWTHMNDIIERLSSDRKRHAKEAREHGEKIDKSYEVLINVLDGTRTEIRNRSDELFAEAEAASEKYDSGYEALANAILELVALDYEAALCGGGNESEKHLIELFAKHDANFFTDVDFAKVLKRIEEEHPKFVKIVHEQGDEIIKQTHTIRRNRGNIKRGKIRCPLCGNGLDAFGNVVGSSQMIRCSGCNFNEYYTVKPHGN